MKNYKSNLMKWNLERYNSTPIFYQKFQILLLMENANTHLVSKFKDYLLFDDMTEFFKEYYNSNEIYSRLKTIYDYYESSSYLFPNYTAINEGKYIYKNIIKKQKLIDYLEDLEDKKKEKEEKRKNQSEESSCSEVFDTQVYDNIRKETGNDSKINELFCVGSKENSDCDSICSIMKLTEILKSKDKEKKENINNNSISNNTNNKNNNITLSKDNNNNISYGNEAKIFVSRKLNTNSISNNKRYINNFMINNNNTSSNLTSRKINHYNIIKNISSTNKTNDFFKNINKNESKKVINSYKKNGYKKNNIIINIINNNKNNNYNNLSNHNTNDNNNQFNLSNNFFCNYNKTNENKNNLNTHNISNSNSAKSNKNIKIKRRYIKPKNMIKDKIMTNGLISKITTKNNRKNVIKRQNKDIKSKLLAFRLTTDILQGENNMIRNLTDRMKNQSLSNSIKKNKVQSKIKNIISPYQNMKKRTKTEISGTKSDIFLFGHQSEVNCNKSINRQILKNINLTNTSKHKKEMSLINKKIINYHFNINNSKAKYIKHSSTNSQNLTKIGIINKTGILQIKDISNKKGGILSFNKTQRTSRNNSKEKINTIIRKNYKDSLSPKKSQEIIYSKIYKMRSKHDNNMISSFLKSVNSNRKIKNLKIKKKYNNINYKSVNINSNVKDIYTNIKNNKNRK